MTRRLTNEEVSKYIESYGYKLLTSYVSSTKYIKIRCPKGHDYDVRFPNFKNGSRCPTCAMEIRKNKLKTSIDEVKQTFINAGLIPLFEEYLNANSPLLCICSCGNEWITTYYSVKEGKKCRKCMGKRSGEHFKHDFEYVKKYFNEQNCILLSTTYENGKQKLDYICSCGNKSIISFEKFKKGQRCKCCRNRKISKKTKGVPRPMWRGENHPNWKPNKTDEERKQDRKFFEYHEWRKQVFERDSYTCQCCNKVGHNLNAHHLDGYNWCIEKRLDVDNGITVCDECHKQFHKIYGKGDNTKEQFEEFLHST